MNEIQAAAIANLKAASAGKPFGSYCQVSAGDVAEAGKLVGEVAADDPAAVLVLSVVGLKPAQQCHPLSHVVRHLIELAEAHAHDADPGTV